MRHTDRAAEHARNQNGNGHAEDGPDKKKDERMQALSSRMQAGRLRQWNRPRLLIFIKQILPRFQQQIPPEAPLLYGDVVGGISGLAPILNSKHEKRNLNFSLI
jgi:hypothetical protein